MSYSRGNHSLLIVSKIALGLFLLSVESSYSKNETSQTPLNHQSENVKSTNSNLAEETSTTPKFDCSQGLTKTDKAVLLELENELKKVKDAGTESTAFKKRADQLIDQNIHLLSPLAKASFVQVALKQRMQLIAGDGNALKKALRRYDSNVSFHTTTFGPGGTYSSMGMGDILFGKADQIMSKSIKDIGDSSRELHSEIRKHYDAGRITEEQKSQLLAAMREIQLRVSQHSDNTLDASIQRIKSEQKTIALTGAAAIATVLSAGAATGTFAGLLGPTATTALLGSGTGVAGTIFAGQGTMLAKAASTDGNLECEYAIRAIQENDQLARSALKNGLIGAIAGVGVGKLLGIGGNVASKTVTSLKTLGGLGIGASAFGGGIHGKKALDFYAEAHSLAEQSDKAFAEKNYARSKELETSALAALKNAQEHSTESARAAIYAVFGAIGVGSLGKLKDTLKIADTKLAKGTPNGLGLPASSTLAKTPKDPGSRQNVDRFLKEKGIEPSTKLSPLQLKNAEADELARRANIKRDLSEYRKSIGDDRPVKDSDVDGVLKAHNNARMQVGTTLDRQKGQIKIEAMNTLSPSERRLMIRLGHAGEAPTNSFGVTLKTGTRRFQEGEFVNDIIKGKSANGKLIDIKVTNGKNSSNAGPMISFNHDGSTKLIKLNENDYAKLLKKDGSIDLDATFRTVQPHAPTIFSKPNITTPSPTTVTKPIAAAYKPTYISPRDIQPNSKPHDIISQYRQTNSIGDGTWVLKPKSFELPRSLGASQNDMSFGDRYNILFNRIGIANPNTGVGINKNAAQDDLKELLMRLNSLDIPPARKDHARILLEHAQDVLQKSVLHSHDWGTISSTIKGVGLILK